MILSLLNYLTAFFCNCCLAYKIAQPADRQGLILFILLWLLFTVLTRSTDMLLPIVQNLYNLIKKGLPVSLSFKKRKNFSHQPLYNLLYILAGLLLWVLMQPGSVWQGFLYVTIWQLLALGILPWFTKATAIDNKIGNNV
jgi:hypothetical protein